MEFVPDQIVGSYRIVRVLGQGGMGTVYEVEHTSLKTHYALKTFSYDPNDDARQILRNKFFEEARILANLNHPNLVHVFDLTADEQNGVLYFVMDLVQGKDGKTRTLDDIEDSITEDRLRRWYEEIASVLDYIHSKGIVHRDIKPANFLVSADDHLILADFGISKILQGDLYKRINPERTMEVKDPHGNRYVTVLGTEHYMAPEVQTGHTPTPAADAYAVGTMFYRFFTGKWADKCVVSQVENELHGYKYRWYRVIPDLVQFDAEKRPAKLTPLSALLDRSAVNKKPKLSNRIEERRSPLAPIFFLLVAVAFGVAGYFGFTHRNSVRSVEVRNTVTTIVQTQVVERVVKELSQESLTSIFGDDEPLDDGDRQKVASEPVETPESVTDSVVVDKTQPSVKVDVVDEVESEAEQDYGPIPDRVYNWKQKSVDFELANGTKFELIKMKKGVFFMSNHWTAPSAYHKVTITRPFWMSKFVITAAMLRDFKPNGYDVCRDIEKAVGPDYTVSVAMSRKDVDRFCAYLNKRYRSQLPKGYIFRLPTAAEWEYAGAGEETKREFDWNEICIFSHTADELMEKLRQKKNLDILAKWRTNKDNDLGIGWTQDAKIYLGGLMKPAKNGFCDMVHRYNLFYDLLDVRKYKNCTVEGRATKVLFAQSEVDPLMWTNEANVESAAVPMIQNTENRGRRYGTTWDNAIAVPHLVLGPDLVAERAWKKCKVDEPKVVKRKSAIHISPYSAQWNPKKLPKKVTRPVESSFIMDNEAKMEFCLCPAGSFRMSNVPGQSIVTHRVTIDYPFWMTKRRITTEQWRDFAPYDCEDLSRDIEDAIKKSKLTVSRAFARRQWEAYCAHLNRNYGMLLPEGYVFRLPTEAEMEWAMLADENQVISNLSTSHYMDADPSNSAKLSSFLRKRKFAFVDAVTKDGFCHDHYIGGVTQANKWGICDFWAEKLCLDIYDADVHENIDDDSWHRDYVSSAQHEISYGAEEKNPLHWDGRFSTFALSRIGNLTRRFCWFDDRVTAYVVVAPDFVTERKRREEANYPEHDFGGKFLGDVAKVAALSSRSHGEFNGESNYRRLLSRENVVVREKDEGVDTRNVHVGWEDNPWVKIELDRVHEITGFQIETFENLRRAKHLRVSVSEDGEEWKEVCAQNRELQRYRFDLREKRVKAKYIKVHRQPYFIYEFFHLSKILIYGK